MVQSAGADGWEDSVATYCLSIGVQFGFQSFVLRKASTDLEWFPSTTFIATHTLTETLRDVASRSTITADPRTPPALAGLACAVRDLHTTIFQPYATWLKAAHLRPPNRRLHPSPNTSSLHVELADLALYWLIFSEAANLRHTSEMLWFIFYCAQRSWQAKQVLRHLRLHQSALSEQLQQPWLQALGPGLPKALKELHARFRAAARAPSTSAGGGTLFQEATLKLPAEMRSAQLMTQASEVEGSDDARVAKMYAGAAACAVVGDITLAPVGDSKSQRSKPVQVTVLADGGVSMGPDGNGPWQGPRTSIGGSGSPAGSPSDDARGMVDRNAAVPALTLPRSKCPESPCLPLPPKVGSGAAEAASGHPTYGLRGSSVFAAAGAATAAAAAAAGAMGLGLEVVSQEGITPELVPEGNGKLSAPPPAAAGGPPMLLTELHSTPRAPSWNPRLPPVDYRDMLLRLCPDEAAVAAALASGDPGGCGGGSKGGSGPSSQAGSAFLTRVVQPLFLFLTEQVYELGQARRQGLESAVRIGYDDVSESMAHPRVVAAALESLPWAKDIPSSASLAIPGSGEGWEEGPAGSGSGLGRAGQRSGRQQLQPGPGSSSKPRAAVFDDELYWSRLLALSDLPASDTARIPWQGDMAHYRHRLLKLLQGGGGAPQPSAAADTAGRRGGARAAAAGGADEETSSSGEEGDLEAPNPTVEQAAEDAAAAQSLGPDAAAELGSLRRANAAADWWGRHVLRKTFVEHRSIAMPIVAFARVYQFQLLWFYLLCAWAWSSRDKIMHWVASAAALHWGTNCLLWSMQAVLSMGPKMKRRGAVIPFYVSNQGRARKRSGPAAPYSLYSSCWWLTQLSLLALCWAALAAGLYLAFIVWPNHDLYGYQCYPLLWGRSCYWWIALVYGCAVVLYEVLYRQFNTGGYVRTHLYDALLRYLGLPSGGTASASSASSPLYDPATHLRTGLSYVFGNAVLWGFALALKFVIDYFIIVQPAGPRLAEILATNKLAWSFYINLSVWPKGWSRHFTVDLDPCMAAAQVIVMFLLSMVSSGVAYSVAGAIWGVVQGVHQGLGSIRHWTHIRAGFHRVQVAMRAKLLTTGGDAQSERKRSPVLRALRWLALAVVRVLLLPYYCVVWLLRWSGCLARPEDIGPKSWVQREETLAITAPFWNAVVRSMRGRDLLSDKEAAALSFCAVSLSPAAMMATWRRGGSHGESVRQSLGNSLGAEGPVGPKETYLPPVAVYVAQIPHMVISGATPTSEQLEVLQEAYLYLLHLLVAVGAIPRSEQAAQAQAGQANGTAAASAAALCPGLHKDNFHPDRFASMRVRASSHKRLVARRELLGAVVALVRGLMDTGKAFKDTAGAVKAGGAQGSAATASRNRAIDKLVMALHALARCMTQMHDLPWSVSQVMSRVLVRQYFHQQTVKAALSRGFATLVADNRNNATAWGAEHMPSYEDFAKVSSWLLAILRPTDEGTAPTNAEAVSLLADFCSGLMHPALPTAPRVDAMRSVSTLIPHYQETVLYALSSADARRVLERAGATSLEGSLPDDEVLFKNDEGAPSEMLQYLVSEFPDEFRNLLERCRTIVPLAKDERPYTLDDFLQYGRLYEHRAQLLLWASFRGQVLARTVDGMSMYRTALAMQAVQDAMIGGGRRAAPARGASGEAAGHLPQTQQQQRGGAAAADGRLKLSGVDRLMVQGILRDSSLSVDEMVAQLADVLPGLGPMLDRKYGLVVSSQVFAKMAASKGLPDRWRAHGIALLATRYPALKVAYLEQDGEPLTLFKAPDFTYRVVHQASVLVRAVPIEREVAVRRQAKAERAERAAAAAAAAAATVSSPASTAPYGAVPDLVSGGGTPVPAASPTPTASWMDGCSVAGDNEEADSDEEEEGGGDGDGGLVGDGEDAGAALRVWRRRHMLKHLQAAELEVLFRQQLPVNFYDRTAAGVGVILGEGKPENQNSALPYCTGVLLQTIDMNQDNSLAQAFKLRNATREFEPLGPSRPDQQVAVVGYPEWIFSYRCGLLADLAAATERTFGTQIQRVMAYPSGVRAHYGHPDLWNKLFSMTRGGVSKANAVQHVSEDVFGGYNALKRGGLSKYVSYISVGKGRDMGLDSILGFEGKISKGCAEQLMSRDLRFLGTSTDFFRSMSLYFTVPGHFINTWLTVLTIRLGVWVQLLLLLGGVGKAGGSLATAMGAVQILQLGTMPLVGYIFNLWLESGLSTALATLARQFIAGGLLFHIFRSVTSAFHLGRAVLFGGASYVATGRGFSLRRKTFTQVYVNYGRSHLYLGADILLMCILILVVGNNGGNAMPIPAAALWSPLLVAAALLAGPFWFTPYFFRLNQVMRDTREFRTWLAGSAARGVGETWPEWNGAQLSALRDDAGAQVRRYRFWSTAAIVLPRAAISILSTIVAVTGARFAAPPVPDLLWVLGGSAVAWVLLAGTAMTRKAYLTSGLDMGWRWARGGVQVVALAAACFLAAVCLFMNNKGLRFSGTLITLYANYQVAALLVSIWVVWFPKTMPARSLANTAYRHADAALGAALCAVLIVICFIGEIGLIMLDKVQTLVQFNDRYSHSQAAKPYAGEDDPTVAAAAGAGGAGALRRRLPSHLVAPARSGGGGGGGTGSRTPTGGASGMHLGSTPPSVVQGWVSPRYGGDGGATPVYMANAAAAAAAATAAADTSGAAAANGALASPSSPTPTTPTAAFAEAFRQTPQAAPTRTPTSRTPASAAAASTPPPSSSPALPASSASALHIQLPTPPSIWLQREVSAAPRNPSSGNGDGSAAALPNPGRLPSGEASWSSSIPPSITRQTSGYSAGGDAAGGRAAAAAQGGAAHLTSMSPFTNVTLSHGGSSIQERQRLPPAPEWQQVAVAAAGVAASRTTSQQLQQGPQDPSPSNPARWGQRQATLDAPLTSPPAAATAATPADASAAAIGAGRVSPRRRDLPPIRPAANREGASPLRSRSQHQQPQPQPGPEPQGAMPPRASSWAHEGRSEGAAPGGAGVSGEAAEVTGPSTSPRVSPGRTDRPRMYPSGSPTGGAPSPPAAAPWLAGRLPPFPPRRQA